jgi:hypothetical protein
MLVKAQQNKTYPEKVRFCNPFSGSACIGPLFNSNSKKPAD